MSCCELGPAQSHLRVDTLAVFLAFCVRSMLQNYRPKKSRSFGGNSLEIPFGRRETVSSPPLVIGDIGHERSESLPTTPSDAAPHVPMSQQHPGHYRYPGPGPGYWPMSYDMRMWAGLQMQQYLMDPQRQAEHGHGERCSLVHTCFASRSFVLFEHKGKKGKCAYSSLWIGNPSQSYGASPAIWDHTVLPAT